MRVMMWTDPIPFHQPPTAYSKVAEAIYEGLKTKHRFAHTPMAEAQNLGIFKWQEMLVYPSGQEGFGEDVIETNALHFNSDLVFVLKDLFTLEKIIRLPLECLFYVPVDHSPISPAVEVKLKTAFKTVAMSRFGEEALKEKGLKVDAVIPHGYDPSIYFPRFGVEKDKARAFLRLPTEDFFVGFIGVNRARKMIPRVLQVFKRLLEISGEEKHHIRLMLWTDVSKDIPLLPTMRDIGLQDYVYWPMKDLYRAGIPEKDMWMFYNAMDVVVGVAGEGFWLPGLEAQACGVPIVVADYGAAAELVGSGFKAKVSDYTYINEVGVRQPLVDLDDMAQKILEVKHGDRDEFREKAVQFAKPYVWENIIQKHWVPLLDSCEEELRPMINSELTFKRWDQEVA